MLPDLRVRCHLWSRCGLALKRKLTNDIAEPKVAPRRMFSWSARAWYCTQPDGGNHRSQNLDRACGLCKKQPTEVQSMIDGYNVTVFTRPSPVLQQSVASWGFNMGLKVRTHLRGADSCTVARLRVEVRPNWSWKDMDVAVLSVSANPVELAISSVHALCSKAIYCTMRLPVRKYVKGWPRYGSGAEPGLSPRLCEVHLSFGRV